MSRQTEDKICYFCGQSCAGQPRGKDPAGRYYHNACREARRHDQTPEPAAEADLEILDELLEPARDAAQAVGGQPCPSCGHPLGQAAVCLSCGFNRLSGKTLRAKVRRTETVGGSTTEVGRLVVGIISILWGGFQTISASLNALAILSEQVNLVTLGTSGLLLGLALMLLVGGTGVARRRRAGYVTLMRWAIIQIIIALTCVGLDTVIALVRSTPDDVPAGLMELGAGALLIVLAVVIAWPIIVLVWCARTNASDWG